MPLNNLGREVLQTHGSGEGGAHGIEVRAESVGLERKKKKKKSNQIWFPLQEGGRVRVQVQGDEAMKNGDSKK